MLGFFDSLSKSIQKLIDEHAPQVPNKSLKDPATDGAACDAKHHQVVFDDNSTLKVIDVIVNPNEVEIFHTHERCAVMYVDIPANIILEMPQQIIIINNPAQRFAVIPEEGLHRVTNTDIKQFRAFRFEIKADICSLPDFEALSEKIRVLIESKKEELDAIRKKALEEEEDKLLHNVPKALTLQFAADTTKAKPLNVKPSLPAGQPKETLKL